MTDMDTVVDLMLRYFAALDSGDDAAIEAAYQAWVAGRGEQPAKRLVAIGDESGVTAHTFDPIEEAHDCHIEAMREKRERRGGFEWQAGDDWHAERQELADYDASVRAASIYEQ